MNTIACRRISYYTLSRYTGSENMREGNLRRRENRQT